MSSPSAEFAAPAIDPAMQAVLIGGGKAYGLGPSWEGERPLLDLSLDMTGVSAPNVLIVPSARWASEPIYNKLSAGLSDFYAGRGATPAILHPYLFETDENGRFAGNYTIDPAKTPGASELEEKVQAADVIFVVGGDTNHMLNNVWRPLGIDRLLTAAMQEGTVITGTSAGTIAWFAGGHTDGDSLNLAKAPGKPNRFHYIKALGHITETVVCPHYDAKPDGRSRKKSYGDLLYRRRSLGELGIAIEDNAALTITAGGAAQIVRGEGDGTRNAHASHYRTGKKQTVTLTPADGSFTLDQLV